MSTTSAERSQNPLLSRNRFARAARAAIAALVSAACLASPVAGGGIVAPVPDRALLSKIARDVLLRGAAGLAPAADEAAIPASPGDAEPTVAPSAPDVVLNGQEWGCTNPQRHPLLGSSGLVG